jgi:hypothetical protein
MDRRQPRSCQYSDALLGGLDLQLGFIPLSCPYTRIPIVTYTNYPGRLAHVVWTRSSVYRGSRKDAADKHLGTEGAI